MTRELKYETTHTINVCEIIDSPRSLAVKLLIENGEFLQYLDLDIDPSNYEDASNFADDYLVTKMMSKSPNLPISVDLDQKALDSFLESELICAETNERISSMASVPSWYRSFVREVNNILGPVSSKTLDEISHLCRHGPGATFKYKGRGSVYSDKFDRSVELTASLIPFARSLMGERWWQHHQKPFFVVDGNRFTTVPKNSKTNRGICIEPTLNVFLQLGIGTYLKRRLKSFGCNLSDQTNNQVLAKQACMKGLATIDLSMASDTLASGLILDCVGDRWVELLELCRSGRSLLPDGTSIELQKWSSMGNGYTFELESLIFWATVRTIVPVEHHHLCSVFGDDIIAPQQYAGALVEALEYLGFRVNRSKSFLAGSFFESCGTDWFKGSNVRPYFLKGPIDLVPYNLSLANKLRLYASQRLDGYFCDSRFRLEWLRLYHSTPRKWRNCKVPASFGDSGFVVSNLEVSKETLSCGTVVYPVSHFGHHFAHKRKKSFGRLLAKLAGGPHHFLLNTAVIREYGDFTKGREPISGYLKGVVTRTTVVYQWSCGLQWLL